MLKFGVLDITGYRVIEAAQVVKLFGNDIWNNDMFRLN